MRRPSILVVDEVVDIVELYADYLGGRGFDVLTATNAAEALTLASANRVDAVLMDLAISGADGCEATRQLKQGDATRHVPLIVVTANVAAKHVEAAWDAGADAVLAKPLELGALAEVIAHAVNHREIPRLYSVLPRH